MSRKDKSLQSHQQTVIQFTMRCFRPLGFSSPNLKHKASLRFFTHIILRLNGENTNLAKVSLDVKKAKNVTVYLYDSKRSEIKKVRVSIFIYLMSVSTSMLIIFLLNLVFFSKNIRLFFAAYGRFSRIGEF